MTTKHALTRALTFEEERAALAGLTAYAFDGRVAVASGVEGFNASINWSQKDASTHVRLSGPFGAGALQVSVVDGVLQIDSSKGEHLSGDDARAALEQRLGFAPPIESLRFWLVGLADPASIADEQRRDDGRLASLLQNGWRVDYEEYRPQTTAAGTLMLPRQLRATRENLKLRVVTDKWRLTR